jgi:hypothetical protein
MPNIYKVKTVGPIQSKHSDLPQHADMLRYDSAYHDPSDLTRIIFPEFKGYKPIIHHDRWRSFLMKVEPTEESVHLKDCMNWITYENDSSYNLIPITLEEYLKTHEHRKLKGAM